MNIDLISKILGLATLVVVPTVLLYWYFVKNTKLSEEKGLTPVYQEVGGGRFDGVNYTLPFVRISIYDRFLVISYSRKILLTWNDISEVTLEEHLISTGIRILHNRSDIPKLIILWSKKPERLLESIQSKLQR